MNPLRTTAIMLRQFYLIKGSMSRVLPLFVWVTIDMILWGFISKYLNNLISTGFNFLPLLLGAVLMWDFFSRVMHGVTIAFFEDVWARNFLNIFASPLSISEYLCGLVCTSIITSLLGLLVMLFIASTIFGISMLSYGIYLIPFLLTLFAFGISLGIASCAIVLRYGPASEWFIWPIPAMLSPFVGVFYPINTLPLWMQSLSSYLPPSYVFEGLRGIISGTSISFAQLCIGTALSLFYILIACIFFIWNYRHVIKTGLIARYSAENLI